MPTCAFTFPLGPCQPLDPCTLGQLPMCSHNPNTDSCRRRSQSIGSEVEAIIRCGALEVQGWYGFAVRARARACVCVRVCVCVCLPACVCVGLAKLVDRLY